MIGVLESSILLFWIMEHWCAAVETLFVRGVPCEDTAVMALQTGSTDDQSWLLPMLTSTEG